MARPASFYYLSKADTVYSRVRTSGFFISPSEDLGVQPGFQKELDKAETGP